MRDFKEYLKSFLPFHNYSQLSEAIRLDLENSFPSLIDKDGQNFKFLKKLEIPSLYSNLLLYSNNLRNYYNSINNKIYTFDYSDQLLFETIIENLCKNLLIKKEHSLGLLLYEKLYEVFIENCIWKREKLTSLIDKGTPGVYILYNKESLVTYVGESNNIEKRFFEHYTSLDGGFHFNRGLQKACNLYGIDSFSFLVFKYGEALKDSSFRKDTEISIMNSWPGPVYNIKDVYNRKAF